MTCCCFATLSVAAVAFVVVNDEGEIEEHQTLMNLTSERISLVGK